MKDNIITRSQDALKQLKSATKAPAGAYESKVNNLKHRIIFSFATSLVLIVVALISSMFYSKGKFADEQKINLLNNQIADLKNRSADIEARIRDAKLYKQLWDKADPKRKNFTGIKVADVNQTFSALASKYNIGAPSLNLSVPEVLKNGVYNRQSLEVNLVNGSMSFISINDAVAMVFISSFFETLPGYVVITDFSITKTKKEAYTESELIDISAGKISGSISSKINFSWYYLKRKEQGAENATK